jgi:anhydro-N-acetylmuramic acid kinase
MTEHFIGLMSGTSLDGVDAALLAFEGDRFWLLATHYEAYDEAMKEALRAVCYAETASLRALGELGARLGTLFGECANRVLEKSGVPRASVKAIGSHGQTVYHHPLGPHAFSLQIGDPARIAQATGIDVVADFRNRDIAAGGQGAPLAPAFHRAAYGEPGECRVIVNIGGIANLTILPAAFPSSDPSGHLLPKGEGKKARPSSANSRLGRVFGFDSGPGNTLMDACIRKHRGEAYDREGAWAASGKAQEELLQELLSDPYFRRPPPKSTGQEYFSWNWLERVLAGRAIEACDLQATLCQLTATSIAQEVQRHAPDARRVLVCGGGAHNRHLLWRLADELDCPVGDTEAWGVPPDWVEAAAFAWLARQTLLGQPGNLPEVTGASGPAILGGIYRA